MLALVFVWGTLGFALVPLLQTLIVDRGRSAQPGVHAEPGRVQPGQRRRRRLGSMALGSGLPLTGLPWMSAAIAAAALLLTLGHPPPRPPRGYTGRTSRR